MKIVINHCVASGGACLPCAIPPQVLIIQAVRQVMKDMLRQKLSGLFDLLPVSPNLPLPEFSSGVVLPPRTHFFPYDAPAVIIPRAQYNITLRRLKP